MFSKRQKEILLLVTRSCLFCIDRSKLEDVNRSLQLLIAKLRLQRQLFSDSNERKAYLHLPSLVPFIALHPPLSLLNLSSFRTMSQLRKIRINGQTNEKKVARLFWHSVLDFITLVSKGDNKQFLSYNLLITRR